MITTALVLAGLMRQTPQAPATAVYNNFVLNLAFSYPKTWTLTTKKGVTKLTIPLTSAGDAKATIEIFDAIYGAEPADWQTVQKEINRQLGREVVRQWDETIFGVPMLFTKTHYFDRGADMQALTGLFYNRSYKKLLIRMVAPTGSYDSVEYELRSALQSLITLDGSTPKPETPNRPVLPEETKPAVDPGIVKVTNILPPRERERFSTGAQVEKLSSGGKSVEFHYEKDWKLTKTAAGGFELRNPKLNGVVLVTVNSILDSDPALNALLKAGGQSLDLFSEVKLRDEKSTPVSRAGNNVTFVWRDGTGKTGHLNTVEAVGTKGDYYWLLTYQAANATPADRKLLEALCQTMTIELAP